MTDFAEGPKRVVVRRAVAWWNQELQRVRSPILRYGFSVVCVAIAIGMGLAFEYYGFRSGQWGLFGAGIAFATWYGGIGSCIFAVVLSAACFDYFFTEPIYSFTISPGDLPYFLGFVGWAGIVGSFSGVLRHTTDRLQVEVAERKHREEQIRKLNQELATRAADLERLRRLEADIAHLNRVSMMGELAASLAHEIKQPIAAAAMNAKACTRWLRGDAPDVTEAREVASRMISDVTRAVDIIDRVRSLYGRGAPERELVDVNEIIREMTVLLGDTANRNAVSIRAELDMGLPTTTADRVQLQQVLMNLMLNGIEAMKDHGGELIVVSNRTEDGQLMISVSDSGIGLPIDQAERIFEAFFTTKPQGTGMGLSISRRIVEALGGRLWASHNTGRGATFQFTLPVR